ncbi:hypothetical protein GNF10_24260 [Nostoc sp. UCD121]|uniref:hypothetical protein n=1 Tax=unclassified Nostoc TaxID=2593658 RepID=UPI0016283AA8|nr:MULTISPECIES: hypothetical protein [unclassified Nostoc]MBC1218599.1 hypothetical protein [Nostoc sp. UCD120]MBC1278992.1 hypothetical protein [Nostoc sp. UCD121]MBC1294836.1 hypothetical protein [Nostoc sp. UCD122]
MLQNAPVENGEIEGSREQGAGSREQGAGSREQGAGSREQGAGMNTISLHNIEPTD